LIVAVINDEQSSGVSWGSTYRHVTFDDSHHRRIDTSLSGNPTLSTVSGLSVRHIFRRNKTGDKDRDGNPLIYAMKGMRGYKILPFHKDQFMARARRIVETFATNLQADWIMPLPSNYAFCREVADLICGVTTTKCLSSDFIRKKTIDEMLGQYGDTVPGTLTPRVSGIYKAQLATWRAMKPARHASMKDVDTAIRHCFEPLTLNGEAPDVVGSRVVIVDDLMSTGASLTSAVNLLAGIGCRVTSGICFVSGL
jgi:adenine/guanine phosphoribosyltransferase-like PRPP-binding protein